MQPAAPTSDLGSPAAKVGRSLPEELKPDLFEALCLGLPSREQTWLLQACLLPREKSRRAWEKWTQYVGDPIDFMRRENEGARGLLPLLSKSLELNAVDISASFRTFLRTARLNEEVRSRSYERICRDVFSAVEKHGIDAVVLGGADIAHSVYDQPALRHTADLDLMIRRDDLAAAVDAMVSLGCTVPDVPRRTEWTRVRCRHESGLGIGLRRTLLDFPAVVPDEEVVRRTVVGPIAGIPARMLSQPDSLVRICAASVLSWKPTPLQWVIDASLLITRRLDLDWDVVLDSARRLEVILPVVVALEYLREALNVPVDQGAVESLARLARKPCRADTDLALFAARRSPRGGIRALLRSARSWKSRGQILRWMFFPSPSYLRRLGRVRYGWQVPLVYLVRPPAYLGRKWTKTFARRS